MVPEPLDAAELSAPATLVPYLSLISIVSVITIVVPVPAPVGLRTAEDSDALAAGVRTANVVINSAVMALQANPRFCLNFSI